MPDIRIETLHLFSKLDSLLIDVLESLTASEWKKKTLARAWTVKDVASHLLDGNIRVISFSRDGFGGDPPEPIHSYRELVDYLNRINAEWVTATRRMSPKLLVEFLRLTGKDYLRCLESLDPSAPARFSVAWAGEDVSLNWFHVAREYTERWHHQQQIREAVGRPGIMTREFFYPAIATFVRAMPNVWRNTRAAENTTITIIVTGETGGTWIFQMQSEQWTAIPSATVPPATTITLDPDTTWKLFTKALSPADARKRIEISGDERLGLPVLEMVAVMA